MILELADRSKTRPASIAEDVFVKVGKFYFPTDFVVVDYVVDPRVPLFLGRPFLRTGRALIDVYGQELTLRVDDEAITFKVGQTSKYSYNDTESINLVDVIDVTYEEYVQEVLGFFDKSKSANKQKLREKGDILALKFVEIFRNLQFDLSFEDAFFHIPKFALMFKSLLNNKEKLFDLAMTPVNENCLAVILKKLLEKLGDPGKFLIPCDFPEFDECLALADLGAS
nr:reverse transcriptase domain-containing protein [Tanacetum cinerariifolium]